MECADNASGEVIDASRLKPTFRAIAADDASNCMISRYESNSSRTECKIFSSIEDLFHRIVSGVRDCNKLVLLILMSEFM